MSSLYAAYVDIIPSTKGLKSKLSKEFSAAGPGAGRAAGKGINSGVLGSVGKLAGPLAAAFATLGIGRIIKDSIGNASDLAEAGTAITAVFGDADATIQKFAAGSAASLGQSTNQTLDAARVFGVFGKAAGLGGEDLAGFSTDFITLAADLASFNNTTPESAIQALGAGLRGESEPLRQYGILLDDAALKARATEMGIYSGTGALTQQQKVLAAQAEIMAQTGIQQGDFAKTSEGLANQQRILSAGMTNLSTTFGQIFLPIATTVVGFLNRSVVPAFQGLAAMLSGGETPAAVAGFMGFFQPLIDFFKTSIAPAFATLAPVFKDLIPQLLDLWQAFSPLSLIFKAIGPMLPQLVDAFVGLAVTIGGALGSALTAIMPNITEMSGILVTLISGLITTLLPVIVQLVGIMGPVLSAVITAILPLITSLQGIFMQLFAAILPLLAPILALIVPLAQLIGAILPPLIGLIVAILQPIIALVSGILSLLIPALTFIIGVIAGVITAIVSIISWFVDLVTGAGTAGDDLMAFFENLPTLIGDALGDIGTWLVDAGKDLIQGFIDGIGDMIGGVGDAIGGVMDFVGGFFPHSPAKRGPFSGSGWRAVKDAGLAIGDQFGSGLSASEPGFNAELGSLVSASSLTAKVDASVYGSSAGAAGAAPQKSAMVNVYPTPGMSEETIGRVAAAELNWALRKTK